jgi:hypothetical protein
VEAVSYTPQGSCACAYCPPNDAQFETRLRRVLGTTRRSPTSNNNPRTPVNSLHCHCSETSHQLRTTGTYERKCIHLEERGAGNRQNGEIGHDKPSLIRMSGTTPKYETNLKNAAFWDDMPCGSCENRRYGGKYRLHQTSVLTRAARRNIPEDDIHHSHRRENLKSYIALTDWTL